MSDVNISKFRAQVVRDGSKPATPGFVVSEGQSPTDPAGSGQNHLPVTIAPAATALSITESQILGGAGTVAQYIRGDGSLADFPATTGGGSSVSYYLNGSVSQGTIGGVAYKELNRTPIFGAGTDISINANGYIASFITDALDPNKLLIPAGNWNFETYFSASSNGGSPSFYVELYKYNGTTFTLIATSSGTPELIAFGTNINPYFSTLAVPETVLALTDRLAVRFYVTHSGRTITLHTENGHLCQVITTFTTGLTALNGLTSQVQFFAVGTSGTDFAISSATDTHTFNLPTASATNRGALSSADWSTFNAKQNALGFTPVPETRTITINGTTQDLSANRTYNVGTVTSVGLSSATSGVTIGSTPVTGSGTITIAIATSSGSQNGLLSSTDWSTFNGKQNALTLTTTGTSGAATLVGSTLNIPQYQAAGTYVTAVTASSPLASSGGTTPNITIQQASGSQNGFLSSTDWTTFNNKQNALTNPVTGTGTTNYLPKFTGSTTIGNSNLVDVSGYLVLGASSSVYGQAGRGTFEMNGSADNILAMRIGGSLSGYLYTNSSAMELYSTTILQLSTAGSIRATITSGGNVLIGTTTDAGFKLDVNGTGRFTSSLNITASSGAGALFINGRASDNVSQQYFFSNDGTTLYSYLEGNSSELQFRAQGLRALRFYTNGSERFTITNGGNVGIGTTSPATYGGWGGLDVRGTNGGHIIVANTGGTNRGEILTDGNGFNVNAQTNNALLLKTNDTTRLTITNIGAATFSSTLDTLGRVTITADSGNEQFTIRRASNTNAQLILGYHSDGYGRIQAIEQNVAYRPLVLNQSGGNVLIGTTTDAGYKLDVNGTGRFTGRALLGNSMFVGEVSGSYSIIETTGSNGIWLRPAGVSSPNGMFITSGGNVGIGTSSPAAKLLVNLTTNENIALGSLSAIPTGRTLIFQTTSLGGQIETYSSISSSYVNTLINPAGGNVLIGTTTSAASVFKLQVGDGTTDSRTFLNTNNAFALAVSNSSSNAYYFGVASSGSTSNFQIFNASASTTPLTITYGGNVLIGTTTDNGAKLNVNGTIRTANPTGSTSDGWLLGRALVSGSSTPDRWIRVQIGNLYYDILSRYIGSV